MDDNDTTAHDYFCFCPTCAPIPGLVPMATHGHFCFCLDCSPYLIF